MFVAILYVLSLIFPSAFSVSKKYRLPLAERYTADEQQRIDQVRAEILDFGAEFGPLEKDGLATFRIQERDL